MRCQVIFPESLPGGVYNHVDENALRAAMSKNYRDAGVVPATGAEPKLIGMPKFLGFSGPVLREDEDGDYAEYTHNYPPTDYQ